MIPKSRKEGNQTVLVDYHTHPLAHHPTAVWDRGLLLEFAREAKNKGLVGLGFSDHDRWLPRSDIKLIAELNRRQDGSGRAWPVVRLGVEFDYAPERERELRNMVAGMALDYTIGSVHAICDWEVDDPARSSEYANWDRDRLHETYFGLVAKAAATRAFQIIGHLDLIKIFGCRPAGPLEPLAAPMLAAIRKSGSIVEINTAGRHKPVGEFYPGPELLAACFSRNIPVTLGSDAHASADVGRDIDDAVVYAKRAGYRRISALTDGGWVAVPL